MSRGAHRPCRSYDLRWSVGSAYSHALLSIFHDGASLAVPMCSVRLSRAEAARALRMARRQPHTTVARRGDHAPPNRPGAD